MRADGIQKRERGVVALFIRNANRFTVIDSITHKSGTCESVSYRLKQKRQGLLIGLIYRSPKCEVNKILLDGYNSWSSSGRRLILGDLSSPTVDWKNLRTELLENHIEQKLVAAVIPCAVMQHVK